MKKIQTCLLIIIFSFPFAGCGMLGIKDVDLTTDPETGQTQIQVIPLSEDAQGQIQSILGKTEEANEWLMWLAGLAGLGASRPLFLALREILGRVKITKPKGKKT